MMFLSGLKLSVNNIFIRNYNSYYTLSNAHNAKINLMLIKHTPSKVILQTKPVIL